MGENRTLVTRLTPTSDLKHAMHFANELLIRVRLSSFKNVETIGKNVWENSTDHSKPHFELFFTTISTSKKMFFFFRARAEKGIARHINSSSVVWTVTDNGKLATQIARLQQTSVFHASVLLLIMNFVITLSK